MVRRHWRNPHSSQEGYYGLGIISGALGGWECFGHSGGLQGYISRTCMLPVSVRSDTPVCWDDVVSGV
jgi:hypothetical protein